MKKVLIISCFLTSILLAASCSKENISPILDDDGVLIYQPFIWKYSLHEGGDFNSNSFIDKPIVFENKKILIPTTMSNGNRNLKLLNERGEHLWSWSDIFTNSYPNDYGIDIFVKFDNILAWQVGSRSYCINLNNGKTLWKLIRNQSFDYLIHSYKYNYFFLYGYKTREDGYAGYTAYKGSIETGLLSEFLSANLSCEYIAPISENGDVGGIIYINEIVNTDYLLVTYAEPLPEWAVRSMFGLYNTETQEWVYERVILKEPHWTTSVFHTPIIYNDKAYANVGTSIVCHEVMTGNQKWRRDFPNDFLFSGFIIEDGMLIALCEDGKLYRLNPETGGVVWTGEGAGTSSRMSYMNGVVYFVGGSTGKLHAVDVYTGETVWRLDAELIEGSNAEFRTNAVYVIPGQGNEKGKVVALTHMHAYCFEAYR
ncbi:MAG: PQQ-binding-like beta-propeller repeat protein [Bacteroidetes bacterium]|nr:PQQ-binding-like beta-propeller repeat protein [Bacteroidota bacterium]